MQPHGKYNFYIMENSNHEERQREETQEITNKAKVLIKGIFTPNEIVLSETDEQMPDNQILKQQIEKKWDDRLFAGPLVRLGSFALVKETLNLKVGKTDFKKYVGSRDMFSLRECGMQSLSNPISVSTVLITSDNKIVVADKILGDKTGSIDTPGGYMNPDKDRDPETGRLDIFRAALRELAEEVFLGKDQITDDEYSEVEGLIVEKVCVGLSYEYAGLCHPVLSFAMRTRLSSQELQQKIDNINESPENEIKATIINPEKVPDNPDADNICKLLLKRYPNVEPDGRITIALARKWLVGKNYPKSQLKEIDEV